MLDNDFYNDPKTVEFISETENKIKQFRKKIRLKALDNLVLNPESKTDESETSEFSERVADDKFEKITDFFEKREQYNKEVEKATKKAYSENYRKPPIKYQFKKGKSGNPKGRPIKQPPFTIMDSILKALYKEIETTNNGKRVMKSLLEVFGESVVKDAIKKDGQSRRLLIQHLGIMNHNFMEPLVEENIAKIPYKIDKNTEEAIKRLLKRAFDNLEDNNELN